MQHCSLSNSLIYAPSTCSFSLILNRICCRLCNSTPNRKWVQACCWLLFQPSAGSFFQVILECTTAALGPALHKLVLTKHPVVVILYVILHVNVTRSAEDTINNNVNWNKWPKKDTVYSDLKQCVELLGVCQQPKLLRMKISFNNREHNGDFLGNTYKCFTVI